MAEGRRITLNGQLELIRGVRRTLLEDILPEYPYSKYDGSTYNHAYWTRMYLCRAIEALHSVEVDTANEIHMIMMDKLGEEREAYERAETEAAEQWEANQPSE